jgi:hypothetical protein
MFFTRDQRVGRGRGRVVEKNILYDRPKLGSGGV